MASGLQRVRLEAAHLGIDVDSAPSQVKQGKGLVVQNYLTGEPGRKRLRGSVRGAALAHGSATDRWAISGFFAGNDKLLMGFPDLLDTARTVERHVAPRANAAAADLAAGYDAANNLRVVNLDAESVASTGESTTAFRRRSIPGWKYTRIGKYAYGYGYDSDNDIETPTANFTIGINDSGGRERLAPILAWDTTGNSFPKSGTCGPYGGQDLRLHYNKLLALGGRHPNTGGGFIESNCIWFTRELVANEHDLGFNGLNTAGGLFDPGTGCGTPASTRWADEDDDTNFDTHRINLPGDESDFGVAFANVGRNLAVFKRRSIVLLVGFTKDDWQLRTAVTGVGCIDPRSVVEANEGAYFLSQQGFMYFDGVQLHNASQGVQRTLLNAGLDAVGDAAPAGGFAVGERLDRDYIMLTIGRYGWHATVPQVPDVTFCGLYHIPTNSWSTFTSALFSTTDSAPIWLGRTENKLGLIGTVNTYNAPHIVSPDNVAEADRGQDTGAVNIATSWHSRVAELAMPFERVQLKRVIVDYEWIKDGAATPDTDPFDGPTVTLCDGAGTALGGEATFTLPYGEDDGNEVLRQRWTQEVYGEASEIQVRIEYAGTATALVQCSILDVFIEYQVGHERRN